MTPEFEIHRWDYDEWKEIPVESKEVEKSALSEKVVLSFEPTTADRIKITPKTEYPFDAIYVNETVFGKKTDTTNGPRFNAYVIAPDIPQKTIIPAQQTYVMKLDTEEGKKFIWMGNLWGSASDNIQGHDYQYWSPPLNFNPDGTIQAMEWVDEWVVELD